ncbi:MAG: VWA domain-containing protein, partial [Solimonas sp.]
EQRFEAAKKEGRAAALLQEQRPNMFTQRIANLMPGLPVKVSLRYVQTVPKRDGAYELVVPLVVGPRFVPPLAAASGNPDAAPPAAITALDEIPPYPPVLGLHVPALVDADRVALRVHLDGGMNIATAGSDTHRLTTRALSAREWVMQLADGRTVDNRDFVLRYRLAAAKSAAGLLVRHDGRGGFLSLLVEPPAAPAEADIAPREMVFLLDCSGSMYGQPLDASKAFMRIALRRLRPGDSFRIIRFGDDATEFSSLPLPATPDNIARGIAYTDALRGEGGTLMSAGIRRALAEPAQPGVTRIVTFLTDGYIGNDYEILGLVHELIGNARLFAFGVGNGVNRFLLDEIARAGRGTARYMDPSEDGATVAAELSERLQSPVLTDVTVDWGGLQPTEVYPARIPDLFAGQSLRIAARYAKPGRYLVQVRGRSGGRATTLMVPVELPDGTAGASAVALVWARAAIAEAMREMSLPPAMFRELRGQAPDIAALQRRVTQLGLDHALVTRWTSFVAVSERIYNAHPGDAKDADVPLPQVAGVSERAYAPAATPFTGAAGPEAPAWAGFFALALLAAGFLRRQARALRQEG